MVRERLRTAEGQQSRDFSTFQNEEDRIIEDFFLHRAEFQLDLPKTPEYDKTSKLDIIAAYNTLVDAGILSQPEEIAFLKSMRESPSKRQTR
jgi:hypothetical protein